MTCLDLRRIAGLRAPAQAAKRGLVGALAVIASGAGCGGSDEPRVERLGCHRYCQHAGGYGDAGNSQRALLARLVTRGSVRTLSGDLVPLTVRCQYARTCRGALVLDFVSPPAGGTTFVHAGRSDLVVPAKDERTIGVPLSPTGRRELERLGRVRLVGTADTVQTLTSLPRAEQANWVGVDGQFVTIVSGRSE